MIQALLFILSVSSAFCLNDHRHGWRKWGPVLSLCAQPFWFTSALLAHQWGVVAMTFVYFALAVRGVRNFWFRKVPYGA